MTVARCIAAAALSAVTVFAPLSVSAPTASASTSEYASEPYVTRAEFRQVHRGMAIRRVHRIFDTRGKQTAYFSAYPSIGVPAEQWREYRTRSRYGSVEIVYKKRQGVWRLASKTAYWG